VHNGNLLFYPINNPAGRAYAGIVRLCRAISNAFETHFIYHITYPLSFHRILYVVKSRPDIIMTLDEFRDKITAIQASVVLDVAFRLF
jgi:hypothetical protein